MENTIHFPIGLIPVRTVTPQTSLTKKAALFLTIYIYFIYIFFNITPVKKNTNQKSVTVEKKSGIVQQMWADV